MNKLILIAILTTLSMNASASSDTTQTNLKSFLSFGTGYNKNKATIKGDSTTPTTLDNSYSWSIEYGLSKQINNYLNIGVGYEFGKSETKKESATQKDIVTLPTMGANLYINYTKYNKITPYAGVGVIYTLADSAKWKFTDKTTNTTATFKSSSGNFGGQFKLGLKYNITDNFNLGLEYKYTKIDINLNKINDYYIANNVETTSKINSLSLKLTTEF